MENQTDQPFYRYDAFISYRHAYPDILIAERLHKLLEAYKTPQYLVRQGKSRDLSRVFRDREELPTSSDLNSDIELALQQSRFLIVICSPRTPESKWVTSEIGKFREYHGDNGILALLIEGEPDQAFPQALLGEHKTIEEEDGSLREISNIIEPLAADIRAESIRKSLKKLKTERLRLLAPILGCKYDELKQRHREREVRRRLLFSSALALFFFLFGIFTLYQLKLVKESETLALTNERIAKENEQKALSSESAVLAEMSGQQLADGNRLEAMKLALDALPKNFQNPERPYVYDAEVALYNAYYGKPYQGRTILKGHKEAIQHMEFSKDGTMLATTSEDYSVIVWKTMNGKKITSLMGHTGSVIHCCFNSDGSKLVSSSEDGTVRIWDTQTGRELVVLKDFKNPDSSVFSPDGNSVITHSQFGYQWWDSKSGKELFRFENTIEKYVDCLDVGHGLAVVGEVTEKTQGSTNKYTYTIMNILEGTTQCKIDLKGYHLINSIFSADAAKLVTVTDSMDIWDSQSGKHLLKLDLSGEIPVNVTFSPDGKYILGEAENDITYIWESSSGKKIDEIAESRMTLYNWKIAGDQEDRFRLHFSPDLFVNNKPVSFSPTGNQVLLYSSNGAVQIYNIDKTYPGDYVMHTVNGHNARPQYAVFSPDDTFIAVSYDDNSVCIFDTGSSMESIFSKNICGMATDTFSPDGTKMLTNKENGRLSVWDVSANAPVKEFSLEPGYGGLAVFSPDGRKIAGSCSDNEVLVWNADTGTEIVSLNGIDSKVTCLVFDHHAEQLAAGSENGTVRVWNIVTGKLVWAFQTKSGKILDMAFSPDDNQLAISAADSDNAAADSANIWSLVTGKKLMAVQYNHNGSFLDMDPKTLELFTFKPHHVEYSSEGNRLLCFATTDLTIHIIDPATCREYQAIKATSGFKGAVFSPDGLYIATLGLNNAIGVWEVKTGKLVMDFGNRSTSGYIVRYSHDGKRIMAAYSDGIHIYDAKTGKELFALEQSGWYTDGIFSSDNQRILLSTYGKEAYAWDLITSTQKLIENAGQYLKSSSYIGN